MRDKTDAARRSARQAPARAVLACRRALLAVGLFSLCINVLMLAVPLYMLQLYDRVLSSRSTETLLVLTAMVAFAVVAMGVLEAVRGRMMVAIGVWFDRHLGDSALAGSVHLALGRPCGSSVQALRDLATCRGFLSGPAVLALLDAPWMPVFVLIIFVLHPLLGTLSLAGAAVLVALGVANELLTRRALQDAGAESMRGLADAEAAVRNADTVEAMGMRPQMVARWMQANAAALALQDRAGGIGALLSAASKTARLILQVALLGSGAWLALGGAITPGVMIAASILMARALAPVEQVIGSWKMMVQARGAFARLSQHFAATPGPSQAMSLPAPAGRLSAEGVYYSHPGAGEPLLRGIDFVLEPGEALGIVGPSASGKTTLARLLIGNLAPNAGHVRLDAADMATWPSEERGGHVGYLPQDIEFFTGTVRENIARMTEGTPEAVIEAAQAADVHELVLRLPQGYETAIGDVRLSGGERQRIALARALYGRPRLVVLDEPNSNLDSAGEAALLQAVEGLRARGATLVVIAHRPAVLRHVDRILVLHQGRVEMLGTRADVLPRLTGPEPARLPAAGGSHG